MDIVRAREIVEENLNLMERKNKDYSGGSGDNISAAGMKGMATRLMDKASRFNNLVDKDKDDQNFESIEDTLNDMMNYALIARMLGEDSWGSPPVRSIYLAGPIDINPGDTAPKKYVRNMLERLGLVVYDPGEAFRSEENGNISPLEWPDLMIDLVCRTAIKYSDILVAIIPENSVPFGTIREIEYARAQGKQVILYHGVSGRSAFHHDLVRFHDLDQLITYVKDLAKV